MKFKEGDIVYYVNPFVFDIELIKLDFLYKDENGIYWIDSTGAYIAENDVSTTLEEAKEKAIKYLDRFCKQKTLEIYYSNPKMENHDV